MEKKVFIKTFGCQMNEYDTNRIYDTVKKIGFHKSDNQEDTDCYILNTCHIRDKAKEKVYHEIGRVKKIYKNKKKPIMIIAGCVAQAENQEMINREPYIDIILGPQSYHKINNVLNDFQNKKKKEEIEFDTISKFEFLDKVENKDSSISSYITIQEGCDKFCNFCVVPYTRGPEYSRPFGQILKEVEQLIINGTREITLLGQNVNAYLFQEKNKEYRISDLIFELEKYPEINRIRYTTSHPIDMSKDLIECYASSKKLMPLVHLPIQSGSNKILKLMNRKHTVEQYIEIFDSLKKINSEIEFSSDFIIGYPGEDDVDFNDTINLIEKIKFINSFSFIFSPRPGTNASKLELINREILKSRLIKVQELLFKFQKKKNNSLIGKNIEVLVENKIKDENKLFGRNKYLNSVIFEGKEKNIGKIVNVKIDSCNQNSLFGKVRLEKYGSVIN